VLRLNKKEIDRNQLVKKVNVGFVLEKPILIERFSVEEFLEFTGFLRKMDKQIVKQRINDLCLLLDLSKEKKIENLSNGQKMKVAISAALITNPDYLIMDEPFNGVDFKSARIIGQILRKRVQAGASVLITSHQYDIILELSDRIAILKNGRIERHISKNELISELGADPKSEFVKEKMIGLMGYDEPLRLPDWI
ncbi:MAG TPA: ATP-binding cassette domain-containing protein, partial [Massilibacterium sp.]|nr:ATP-binding cassette domain-containing protein [Massilibacterium sp.]